MADEFNWDDRTGDFSDQTNPSTILRLNLIRDMYTKIGLGDIFNTIILSQIVQDPSRTSREILSSGIVQNSETFKARFKANDERIARGEKPLAPLEYVKLEETFKQYMGQAGLPKGFYDSTDDFQDWIGKGVSAAEVQGRVQVAADAYDAAKANDPGTLQALAEQGIDRDHVMAFFLDPDKGGSVVDKAMQLKSAKVQGSGYNFGVNVSKGTADTLAGQGISQQDAQQNFGQVAAQKDSAERLSGVYGDGVSEQDLITESFGMSGAADVSRRKKKLASQERATFGGTSGIGQGSLSQKKQAI